MTGTVVSIILIGVVFFLYAILLAFLIWMIVDAAKQDKFWWIVLIFGLPILGAIIYYFTEKKHDYVKIPEGKIPSEKGKK